VKGIHLEERYMTPTAYLKHHFFLIREMKTLDINSIQYKKMFRAIRVNFAPLVEKYNKLIFLCKISLIFTIASISLCLLIGGNNVKPERIAAFIFCFVLMMASGLLAMFSAIWANHFVTRYLECLIEKFDVSMHGLSIERMHDIIAAMEYYHDRIEKNELCGCFYCLKTFSCYKAVEEYEDTFCPFCNNAVIIHEYSGYPLSHEFLRQMHEYWVDK
jgi:hypothetical protein